MQRYRADEVVEARPPSVGYRFRKDVRKHQTAVVMAGMAAALLLLGALLCGWQALRATQAEEEAIVERTKPATAVAAMVTPGVLGVSEEGVIGKATNETRR